MARSKPLRASHLGSSQRSSIARPSHGVGGKSLAQMGGAQRRRRIYQDAIQGVTRPAIRRLARRGGVKRISADIYSEARVALKERLEKILKVCCIYVEHRNQRTVTVQDVVYSLRRLGQVLYGYTPGSIVEPNSSRLPSTTQLQLRK